jgi:hypothetical protein
MTEFKYYIVGVVPVKFVLQPDGGFAVLKMNYDTGAFEFDASLLDRIQYARDGVETVSADEFVQYVEGIRARRLSGDGPVYALYQLVNGIEEVARDEGRELTPDEEALIAELRRKSHALFQAAHPDPA